MTILFKAMVQLGAVSAILLSLANFSFANTSIKPDFVVACSIVQRHCDLIAQSFSKFAHLNIATVKFSSGRMFEELSSVNNDIDAWIGGTAEHHLLAAKNKLTRRIFPTDLRSLVEWSVDVWKNSDNRAIALYSGTLGLVSNTKLLRIKDIQAPECWSDLAIATYKQDIILPNPNKSGTGYMLIGSLYQIYGHKEAKDLFRKISGNIKQQIGSGHDALLTIANGEATVGVGFAHDVKVLQEEGYDIRFINPCEGGSQEIGAVSLSSQSNKKVIGDLFIDFVLSENLQNELANSNFYQSLSNINTRSSKIYTEDFPGKSIDYQMYFFGQDQIRKDILRYWNES
ncbi:ABC transporter substrate-binding protein [Reinekea sp.]|jgi:iron(III) transport system substrate-binding protein|uniref:ABC transporter substrate-binding protein n=1 Tax=Reinekea sp. TaxID=1970455 RepID=UPI002A81DC43|nr:extracellular solute-binding protein [Reinekea sp.]